MESDSLMVYQKLAELLNVSN